MYFSYQAVGKSGRVVKGKSAAESIKDLRVDLEGRGLALIDARWDLIGEVIGAMKPKTLPRGVLIDLFGFLRGLMGMGIDMIAAWKAVSDAIPNALCKEVSLSIQSAIHQGHTLSHAMERSGAFPSMVIGNVSAGEVSGTLEEVFEALEKHFRDEQELSQQVAKATMYPLISLVLILGIAVFLLLGVVPQLKELFGPSPPLPTRVLVFLSDSVAGYWWALPLAGGSIYGIWWRMPPKIKGRLWEYFYKFPIVGPVLKNVALCNLFQNFALMLGAGISLTNSLETVIKTVSSRAIAMRMERIQAHVYRGGSMSEGFKDPFFPSVTSGVVAQGEMVGAMDEYFNRLSTFLRARAQSRLHTIATMLEPMLLLVGGGVIMFLMLGIFLPIYQQIQNFGH